MLGSLNGDFITPNYQLNIRHHTLPLSTTKFMFSNDSEYSMKELSDI